MEEGEQHSQYTMERNPRAYMSMRDYRNIPWHNQRPVERNPNPNRSMRDYREQWMNAPLCNVPLTYAPPPHPRYASTPQPQPPQMTSSVEQAILNLSKLVDNFIEEHRAVTVQANLETNTVESSLNKELDVFQSEIDQEFDILQQFVSKLSNQLVHQEEENLEEECILGEQAQMQPQGELMQEPLEAPEELPATEAGEEHQRLTLQPIPINLDPNATAKPKNSPLPVHILSSPAAQSTPKTPTTKATQCALPAVQNLKTLVATVQAYATTSKTLTVAYVAWHSGWFGCWFRHGAPRP